MGKSSLLKYVCKQHHDLFPSSAPYIAVFIDAMDQRAHTTAGFMRVLRKGIAGQLNRDLWPEKDDGDLMVLGDALQELAEVDDTRLVLLLDEWEGVMAYRDLDALLKQLRSKSGRSHFSAW